MKNIQFAIPLLAAILLVSGGMAFAQNVDDSADNGKKAQEIEQQTQTNQTYKVEVDELAMQQFKDDIREILDEDTEDFQARSDEIRLQHEEFIATVIERARIDSDTRILTDMEIAEAKDYVFYETVKDERYKALLESNDAHKTSVDLAEWIGIQTAYAACPNTTPPNFKQLDMDIDGGSVTVLFLTFTFNGDNDLYKVEPIDNPRTCERTYKLYFEDEDHPKFDAAYDELRLILYGRTHDIEMFSIHNNNQIKFDDTWSSTRDYVCLVPHCHYTTTKSYTPGETIYVSNTWNHMMDTSNTNPGMPLTSVP